MLFRKSSDLSVGKDIVNLPENCLLKVKVDGRRYSTSYLVEVYRDMDLRRHQLQYTVV